MLYSAECVASIFFSKWKFLRVTMRRMYVLFELSLVCLTIGQRRDTQMMKISGEREKKTTHCIHKPKKNEISHIWNEPKQAVRTNSFLCMYSLSISMCIDALQSIDRPKLTKKVIIFLLFLPTYIIWTSPIAKCLYHLHHHHYLLKLKNLHFNKVRLMRVSWPEDRFVYCCSHCFVCCARLPLFVFLCVRAFFCLSRKTFISVWKQFLFACVKHAYTTHRELFVL